MHNTFLQSRYPDSSFSFFKIPLIFTPKMCYDLAKQINTYLPISLQHHIEQTVKNPNNTITICAIRIKLFRDASYDSFLAAMKPISRHQTSPQFLMGALIIVEFYPSSNGGLSFPHAIELHAPQQFFLYLLVNKIFQEFIFSQSFKSVTPFAGRRINGRR